MGSTKKDQVRRMLFEEVELLTEVSMMARMKFFRKTLKATNSWHRLGHTKISFAKLKEVPANILEEEFDHVERYLAILERVSTVKTSVLKSWTGFDDALRAMPKDKNLVQLNIQNNAQSLPFTKPVDTIEAEIEQVRSQTSSLASEVVKESK